MGASGRRKAAIEGTPGDRDVKNPISPIESKSNVTRRASLRKKKSSVWSHSSPASARSPRTIDIPETFYPSLWVCSMSRAPLVRDINIYPLSSTFAMCNACVSMCVYVSVCAYTRLRPMHPLNPLSVLGFFKLICYTAKNTTTRRNALKTFKKEIRDTVPPIEWIEARVYNVAMRKLIFLHLAERPLKFENPTRCHRNSKAHYQWSFINKAALYVN